MQTTQVQLNTTKYIIKSSDALDQFRINISEEGSQNVLWYKERHINEHEIVETLTEAASKSVKWTIHKPRDGWYLRLRSPSFPSNVFISLIPPPPPVKPSELPTTNGPSTVKPEEDGSLTFIVRTLPPSPSDDLPISNHSYPPSPLIVQSPTASTPTLTSQPPTQLNEVNTRLNKIMSSPNNSVITRFLLSPSIPPSTSPTLSPVSEFLNRTLAFFSPPIKARVSFLLTSICARGNTSPPLLTFVEQTSAFSVATVGTLTIDKTAEERMGIETAFWVAVSLAYLDFLFDRDSYLAAANG